ncbi:hypothetical protein WDU94_002326 [Cyamophila willieti]
MVLLALWLSGQSVGLIASQCPNIRWHFIGHLQSNKVNKVLGVPNLNCIETIHDEKLATLVNNAWLRAHPDGKTKLKVFVQINTSGEENKNGVPSDAAEGLVGHVINSCPNLEFVGLMTIGKYGYDMSQGPNPDFQELSQMPSGHLQEAQSRSNQSRTIDGHVHRLRACYRGGIN